MSDTSSYYDDHKASARDAFFSSFSTNDGTTDRLLEIINEKLSGLTSPKLLDLGTGNGYIIHELRRRFKLPKVHFTGIDTSSAMLERAQQAADSKSVIFTIMDNNLLVFDDQQLDVVSAKAVSSVSTSEVYRVLKPGGWFVYKEYGAGKGMVEIMEQLAKLSSNHPGDALVHDMKKVGFSRITIEKYYIPLDRSLDQALETVATMRILPTGVDQVKAVNAIRKYYGRETWRSIHSDPFLIIGQK